MLPLSAGQLQRIREATASSFRGYCEKCGYDEQEHSALLLAEAKKKLLGAMGSVKLDDVPDEDFRSKIKSLVEARTILEFQEKEKAWRSGGYAKCIVTHKNHLPIEFNYVEKLVSDLKLQSSSSSPLEAIVEAIPLTTDWGFEFNAFLRGASKIDGIPLICIYEALLAACDAFIDCIAPIAIEFSASASSNKARARSVSDARAMGSQTEFTERLVSCLKLAIGASNYALATAPDSRPSSHVPLLMIEGAIQFVWFHEFGHLLLGHLEQPPSRVKEFQADHFALTVLSKEYPESPLDVWLSLGSITVLVLLDITERIRGGSHSETHPSSESRVRAALEYLDKSNAKVAGAARGYLRSLSATCETSLQKAWGIRLPQY